MELDRIDKMDENALRNELKFTLRQLSNAKIALNPRIWPAEISAKWNRNIPDTQLAFDEIRKAIGL